MDPTLLQSFIRGATWLDEFPEFKSHIVRNANPESDIFRAVDKLTTDLNLAEFKHPQENVIKNQNDLEGRSASGSKESPTSKSQEPQLKSQSTQPDAIQTEPQSTDLQRAQFQMQGLILEESPRDTGKLTMPRSENVSLSRPPQTSISDVSVSTKVTNMDTTYQPIRDSKKSRKRFSFSSLSQKPKILNSDTAKAFAPPASYSDNRPTSLQKRSSLVGQTLPVYIQRQLEQVSDANNSEPRIDDFRSRTSPRSDPQSKSEITTDKSAGTPGASHSAVSTEPEEKPRQDPRIYNLISSSASLHFHAGNKGPAEPTKESVSPILEAELEYISPNSLTKSIEYLEPSFLNSADGSDNEYNHEDGGSSSTQDDEIFFSRSSDS